MKGDEIRTVKTIAATVGIGHVARLLELIARRFDPCPVFYRAGHASASRERLKLWRRREQKDPTLTIADGARGIAHALERAGYECSRTAVMRLARREHHPLPVHGVDTDHVWAYVSALEDWIDAEREPGWRHWQGRAPAPVVRVPVVQARPQIERAKVIKRPAQRRLDDTQK